MEEKTTVTMYYPPDAPGPHAMILTGAGYFEKGKLTEVADRRLAEDIETRKKGPRIATAEDLAALDEKVSGTADRTSDQEPADANQQTTGDKRRAKKGERQAIG